MSSCADAPCAPPDQGWRHGHHNAHPLSPNDRFEAPDTARQHRRTSRGLVRCRACGARRGPAGHGDPGPPARRRGSSRTFRSVAGSSCRAGCSSPHGQPGAQGRAGISQRHRGQPAVARGAAHRPARRLPDCAAGARQVLLHRCVRRRPAVRGRPAACARRRDRRVVRFVGAPLSVGALAQRAGSGRSVHGGPGRVSARRSPAPPDRRPQLLLDGRVGNWAVRHRCAAPARDRQVLRSGRRQGAGRHRVDGDGHLLRGVRLSAIPRCAARRGRAAIARIGRPRAVGFRRRRVDE